MATVQMWDPTSDKKANSINKKDLYSEYDLLNVSITVLRSQYKKEFILQTIPPRIKAPWRY